MNNFGCNLKNLRKERKLTQAELAKAIGVGRTTITSYENSTIVPKQQILIAIAEYFNVSIDFLTGVKLNDEDNQDISKQIHQMLHELQNQQNALMFDGEILDDNTRKLLIESLKSSLKMAKVFDKLD